MLKRRQTITFTSSTTPATFVCTVDDETVPCGAAGLSEKFRAGTHVVTVAAVNAAGVADPTPAQRHLHGPAQQQHVRPQG